MPDSQTLCLDTPEHIARAVMLPESYGDMEGTVFPAADWLRANMPISRAQLPGYDPIWLITKHADNRTVLSQADLFHSADCNIMLQPQAGDQYLRSLLGGTTHVLHNLSYMEPPEHGKYRKAIQDAFLPAEIRKFDQRFREIAKTAVDSFLEHDGVVDVVEGLSTRYPLNAVLEMLGVPQEDYDQMLQWTQETFAGDDPDVRREDIPDAPEAIARQWLESINDFNEYFEDVRKDRLLNDRNDLATAIVNAKVDGGELMPPRIQNNLTSSVAIAGHDTTSSSIAGAIQGLATHPDQLRLVKENPSLIPGLVDESLRWAAPTKHFTRNATRDTVVNGVPIKAGDRLMCMFFSGNRDEDVFERPYEFDVRRRPNPHLSFSYGPHVCLGQHLAKLEMRVLFEELLPRIESLELAGEATWRRSNFVGGYKYLPIRFKRA